MQSLASPSVRDLAWACFSPALLDSSAFDDRPPLHNCHFELSAQRQEWLRALDREPEALLKHLGEARKGRLGLYFEKLWHFFLDADAKVTLVAHNLPVRDATHTLGEFDVIYYCHQRQCHVHLELAVKFYLLRAGAAAGWHNWLGPNSRDRLDRKIRRMREHQLRLADTPAGRSILAGMGVTEVLREMEIKGRLYRHSGSGQAAPPAAAEGLSLGTWAYLHELPLQVAAGKQQVILARSDWFAPLHNASQPFPAGDEIYGELRSRLAGRERPQQVAVLDGKGAECERYFVVPEDWPSGD